MLVFMSVWSLVVYCPIVTGLGNRRVGLGRQGAFLDYAGGTVVISMPVSPGSRAVWCSEKRWSGYGKEAIAAP